MPAPRRKANPDDGTHDTSTEPAREQAGQTTGLQRTANSALPDVGHGVTGSGESSQQTCRKA